MENAEIGKLIYDNHCHVKHNQVRNINKIHRIIFPIFILFCDVWGYGCNESYCIDPRLAIGGYYGAFTTHTANSKNAGAYISSELEYYSKQFYIGAKGTIGIAKAQTTDNQTSAIASDKSIIGNSAAYIGTNLGSLESPILLSFATYFDIQNIDSNEREFLTAGFFLGADVSGRFMLDKAIGIEYSAGYAYNISKRYYANSSSALAMQNHGYRIECSVGLMFRRGYNDKGEKMDFYAQLERLYYSKWEKKLDFYTKLKGIYYNNKAFDIPLQQGQFAAYPANNNYTIMLEFGASFNL